MHVPVSKDGRKSWRCAFGFHRWVGRHRADGERFTECDRCGTWEVHSPNDDTHWGMGAMGGG